MEGDLCRDLMRDKKFKSLHTEDEQQEFIMIVGNIHEHIQDAIIQLFKEYSGEEVVFEEEEEEEEEWSWNNFTMLTDMEIYNCKELTTLPMNILAELPELQMLNVACNQKIPGDVLLENWNDFIDGKSGDKIQVLYSYPRTRPAEKDGETGYARRDKQ